MQPNQPRHLTPAAYEREATAAEAKAEVKRILEENRIERAQR